jgi:peptide/nickel transport system permease protein
MAGGIVVLILIVAGGLAPWISPYDPNQQNLSQALRPPAWLFGQHVLGTDAVGRDILSRLFYGARISLVIAVLVVIISGVVGVVLGAVSGYFAKTTDFLIQKLVEVVWAFPPLLLSGPGKPDPRARQPAVDRVLPGRARAGALAADA